MDKQGEEVRQLRGCVRDLMALIALPALWVGKEAPDVVGSFLDILMTTLRLDLDYAWVRNPDDGPHIEMARAQSRPDAAQRAQEIGAALKPVLGTLSSSNVPNPLGGDALQLAVAPLMIGTQDVIVAGSRRADFPNLFDTVLLGAAVKQVAIWFRGARMQAERACAETALAESEGEQHRLENENAYLREEFRLRLDPVPPEPAATKPSAPRAVIPEAERLLQERENVVAALKQAGGRVHGPGGAAELLGLKPSTLSSRLRALDIRAGDPRRPHPGNRRPPRAPEV